MTGSGSGTGSPCTGTRPVRRSPGPILADWISASEQFVTVMPQDYRRVLEATERAVAEGRSVEEAVMEASHG